MSSPEHQPQGRARAARWLRAVVYWLVVIAVSLALVVAFILFLESRDPSSLDREQGTRRAAPGPAASSGPRGG